MDLNQINDINQLKAMAYDQLALKEQAETNLAVINRRIGELLQEEQDAKAKKAEKK